MLKGQLFVNAAALQQRLGGTDMDRMGGLGERMPWTSLTAGIAALSTAGIPPLAGFWSKLIIIIALWQAGLAWYAAAAVAISVVTLGYMLTMQRKIFFGQLAEGLGDVREASPALVVPAVALAAISVGVGVTVPVVGLVVDVFQKIAAGILGHG
jgi:multicomponent Na+:H+ antiporter subunit D